MKKKILFVLILAVLFSACKMKLSENSGTVFIDFGGNERAVDSEDLPIIKDAAMSLEINSSSQGTQKIDFAVGKEKTWSGTFPVGEELTITVTVRTAAAQWRGSARHRVTSGVNTVSIKLKKSAVALNSLLFDTGKPHASQAPYTLTLKIGSNEIKKENIKYHNFCCDNKGRTYLAYQEGNDYKLERYTSEGNNEDKNFTLPEHCHRLMLASDHTTGAVYLVAEISGVMKLYRINEDGTHTELTGVAIGYPTGYAVYKDILISADRHQLKMYRINGDSLSEITLPAAPQPNLSEDAKIMLDGHAAQNVQINDLYMTDNALYVLFSAFDNNSNNSGKYYSLGGIVKYSYTADGTNGTISNPQPIGINAGHTADAHGIYATDESTSFYGPVKVAGFDDENLYIADDGVKFEVKNGLPRLTENKNRIATLKKLDNNLKFDDTNEAEWLAKEKPWVPPAENPLVFFSLNKNNGNTLDKLILSNDVSGSAPIDIASNIELDTDNYRNIFYTFDRDNNFYLGAKDKLKKFTKSDGSYNEDTSFVGSYTSGVPTETPYIKPTYDIVTETLYAVTNGGNYKLVKYTESGWSDTNIDNVYYEYAVYNNKVYLPADAGKMCIQRVQGSSSSAIIQLPKGVTYKRIDDIFIADDYCYVLRKSNFDNLATLTYFDVNTLPSNTSVTHPIPEGQMKELSIEGLTKFENIKFTGYRDGKLYIAVDGIKRSAVEGAPKLENINKTVSFNTSAKTFDSPVNVPDGITWFREENKWHGTKTLVWKKNSYGGFDYYQLENAGDTLPSETFKPGDANVSGDNSLTDVFCYDEGGNLYIVKYRSGTYQVCRFELQDDGSYNTYPDIAGGSTPINLSDSPDAIAVGKSGNTEYLYYSYNSGVDGHVKRLKWSTSFLGAQEDGSFTAIDEVNKKITALAANQDGFFAALKSEDGNGYTVDVQKYAHTGSTVGTAIHVLDEVINGGTWSRPGDVTALHIHEGFLYGLTAVQYCYAWSNSSGSDVYYKASISGKLLKIGNSTADFTGRMQELYSSQPKNLHAAPDEQKKEGGKFAPYRFIAVKPKKLVIASDGFWGYITDVTNTSNDEIAQFNFIWDFSIKADGSLEGSPTSQETSSSIEFSKELTRSSGCDFDWK